MTFTETVKLEKVDCGQCGGTYALNGRFVRERVERGGFWNCPYCKTSWGYNESENSKLKKELEQTQIAARQAKCRELEERLRREDTEKKLSKVKCRVKNGVCPCCNRSFTNLRRHMATKHKDYKP